MWQKSEEISSQFTWPSPGFCWQSNLKCLQAFCSTNIWNVIWSSVHLSFPPTNADITAQQALYVFSKQLQPVNTHNSDWWYSGGRRRLCRTAQTAFFSSWLLRQLCLLKYFPGQIITEVGKDHAVPDCPLNEENIYKLKFLCYRGKEEKEEGN